MRAEITRTVPGTSSAGRLRLRAVAFHVGHLAVTAGREPALEQRFVLRERGVGDAELGEAELAPELFDGGGELVELCCGEFRHADVGSCAGASIIAAMSGPAEELPEHVYSVADVRALERLASERGGIPSYDLMCRAGAAALAVVQAALAEREVAGDRVRRRQQRRRRPRGGSIGGGRGLRGAGARSPAERQVAW